MRGLRHPLADGIFAVCAICTGVELAMDHAQDQRALPHGVGLGRRDVACYRLRPRDCRVLRVLAVGSGIILFGW